jgi:hypothetical protein
MLDKLRKLLTPKTTGLVCPRCEESLEDHDDTACARRMSRRYFFGVVGGGLVAAAVGPQIAKISHTFYVRKPPRYLTSKQVTNEVLSILHESLANARKLDRDYDGLFGDTTRKHLNEIDAITERWKSEPLFTP